VVFPGWSGTRQKNGRPASCRPACWSFRPSRPAASPSGRQESSLSVAAATPRRRRGASSPRDGVRRSPRLGRRPCLLAVFGSGVRALEYFRVKPLAFRRRLFPRPRRGTFDVSPATRGTIGPSFLSTPPSLFPVGRVSCCKSFACWLHSRMFTARFFRVVRTYLMAKRPHPEPGTVVHTGAAPRPDNDEGKEKPK
jgi:hypothetical protein